MNLRLLVRRNNATRAETLQPPISPGFACSRRKGEVFPRPFSARIHQRMTSLLTYLTQRLIRTIFMRSDTRQPGRQGSYEKNTVYIWYLGRCERGFDIIPLRRGRGSRKNLRKHGASIRSEVRQPMLDVRHLLVVYSKRNAIMLVATSAAEVGSGRNWNACEPNLLCHCELYGWRGNGQLMLESFFCSPKNNNVGDA